MAAPIEFLIIGDPEEIDGGDLMMVNDNTVEFTLSHCEIALLCLLFAIFAALLAYISKLHLC